MYTKKKNFGTITIIGLLIITTVASIGWYISRPQSQAFAVNNYEQQEAIQEQQVVTKSTQAEKPTDIRSKTLNDITVEIVSTNLIATGLEVGVCYSTPDGGDWYPLPGSIHYSTYEILPDEFEFTSEDKADGINMGKRCASIRYRIDDLPKITTPIQFSITGFWAVPKELPPCESLQQRLDTNPKAKAYGLKAKCSYDEQAGISATLSENSSSVAKDKAQQILDEIVKGEINGPWEFGITEIE